ncbi:MAG: hypothetical protein JNL01_00745 [Bdellovibrionales bacterium]|nr:hypothetical protein [Bdellovibrionales bacterium]
MNPIRNVLFLVAGLALAPAAHATTQLDYQVGFGGISYPLGATFFGTVGYGKLLWGPNPMEWLPENGPAKKLGDWKFGFVRVLGNVQTIGISNRAFAEVQFFPISILGLAAGYGVHHRLSKNPNYDCIIEQCKGGLSRSYVRGQFLAGALGAFVLLQARVDQINNSTDSRPFLEETSSLFSSAAQDRLQSTSVMLGYTIDPTWTVTTSWNRQQFQNAGDAGAQNRTLMVNVSRFSGKWNTTLGAGTYDSSHLKNSITFALFIQWMGQRNLGLF